MKLKLSTNLVTFTASVWNEACSFLISVSSSSDKNYTRYGKVLNVWGIKCTSRSFTLMLFCVRLIFTAMLSRLSMNFYAIPHDTTRCTFGTRYSLPHRTTRKNSYKLLIGLGDKVLWSSIAIQDLPIIRWDDHVLASCCNCLYIGNWKQVIILYDNILDNILKD